MVTKYHYSINFLNSEIQNILYGTLVVKNESYEDKKYG